MILSRAASRENRKAIAAQQVLRVKVSRMERKIGIVHRLTVFIGMLASSLCIREKCGFEISVNESSFFFLSKIYRWKDQEKWMKLEIKMDESIGSK